MLGFLKALVRLFGQDKGSQMSAAFAYTAIFSIGPLLLVLVSIVGFIYGQRAASGQLFAQLAGVVGPDTAKTLQDLVAHTSSGGKNVVALAIGIIGTLFAAAALTAQLQNSFNTILKAAADPGAGIKFTIYTKLKNILVVLIGAAVAIASVSISALITGLGKSFWLELFNNFLSLIIFISVLYLIYRVLPDVVIPRKLAVKSAAAVAMLFLIGKVILGFIIGRNSTAGAYGAAAAAIVLLLWFYYSAQIMLLGAEGIKIYGEKNNIAFDPKRYTIKRRRLEINSKKDLRGKFFEAFIRGYKTRSSVKRR